MKIEMRVLPNEKSGEVFGVQRNKAPDLFRRAVRILQEWSMERLFVSIKGDV